MGYGLGTRGILARFQPAECDSRMVHHLRIDMPESDNGLVEPGNIDLLNRPVVKNKDGSVSTVKSMSVEIDGHEVLLPTISPDGQVWSPPEAIHAYLTRGKHLGIFKDEASATKYAKLLHKQQEQMYVDKKK